MGRLVDFNTAAVGVSIPGFFSGLVVLQLLIYAAAAYALHRYSDGQRDKRALVLSVTRTVALAGAASSVGDGVERRGAPDSFSLSSTGQRNGGSERSNGPTSTRRRSGRGLPSPS